MLVPAAGAAHGLAGVVDEAVEPRQRRDQVRAQRLDAGRVAQIDAVDVEAVRPVGRVGLGGVAARRVAREARGHDDLGAGAQELHGGLVADLHAGAGDEDDPAAQVRRRVALLPVQRRARRAHLVVEVVHLVVVGLADVAVLRALGPRARRGLVAAGLGGGPLVGLALVVAHGRVERQRRHGQRRAEHGVLAERADAALIEDGALGLAASLPAAAEQHLVHGLARVAVGPRQHAGRGREPHPERVVERGERGGIGGERLEHLDRPERGLGRGLGRCFGRHAGRLLRVAVLSVRHGGVY